VSSIFFNFFDEGGQALKFRHLATAFLCNGDKVLLLKRGEHRKMLPGIWSGVGGHFEEHEMDYPYDACYREIEEETGIARSDISSLRLQYILLRRYKDEEIRHNYMFFGETSRTDIVQTDEGELFWVPKNEWLDRQLSETFTLMLEHYLGREASDEAVYVGIADKVGGKLHMHWARCEDFE